MKLTKDEIERLKLIQHSMLLEGHKISLEELIEEKKKKKALNATDQIAEIMERAKSEGLTDLEAFQKYLIGQRH